VSHIPRFPALALFGRRPPERVDGLGIPAAENLHNSCLPHRSKQHCYSMTSSARVSSASGTVIADKRILRLIAKWLKVGITEDGRGTRSERGAPQGAVISPILANVYLHYVFPWLLIRIPTGARPARCAGRPPCRDLSEAFRLDAFDRLTEYQVPLAIIVIVDFCQRPIVTDERRIHQWNNEGLRTRRV
jgi:hypothetical protein